MSPRIPPILAATFLTAAGALAALDRPPADNPGTAPVLKPGELPASLRFTVSKDGQPRTLFLEKINRRVPGFAFRELGADGKHTDLTPGPECVYRGRCEEEPDSLAAATVRPDGSITYQVFRSPCENGFPLNGDWGNEWVACGKVVPSPLTLAPGTPVFAAAKPLPGTVPTRTRLNRDHPLYRQTYRLEHGFDITKPYIDRFKVRTDDDRREALRLMEDSLNKFALIQLRDTLCDWSMDSVLLRPHAGGDSFGGTAKAYRAAFPKSAADLVAQIHNSGGGLSAGGLGDVNTNLNGASRDGTVFHVFRHEGGHNLGAPDNTGQDMEGPTIMCGNAVSRHGTGEVNAILLLREKLLRDFASQPTKGFTAFANTFPVPPYAKLDFAAVPMNGAVTVDVLDNDFDTDGDPVALCAFQARSASGGSVSLVTDGAGGKLRYTPPADFHGTDRFSYSLVDATGRTNHGNVVVQVKAPRLVAYWNFDESAPDAALWKNLADPSRDARLANKPAVRKEVPAVSGKPGKFGNALRLAMHADAALLPEVTVTPIDIDADEMTIAGWVNADNWDGRDKGFWGPRILQFAGLGQAWRFNVEEGKLAFWLQNDAYNPNHEIWNKDTFRCDLPPAQTWVHLAAVYRDGQMLIYVNGEQKAAKPKAGPVITHRSNKTAMIGRYLNGALDDLRVYSKGLSDKEIAELMLGGRAELLEPLDGTLAASAKALRWVPGADMKSQQVYFGTDAAAVAGDGKGKVWFLPATTSAELPLQNLTPATTYHWRVDTILHSGKTLRGPVWSFTTAAK